MRLRLCCGCVIDGKGRIEIIRKQKGNAIELQTEPPLREQPKRGESIPLENITGSKKSSLSRDKEPIKLKKTTFTTCVNDCITPTRLPFNGHINKAFSASTETIQNIEPKPAKLTKSKFTTLPIGGSSPTVRATSNFIYISRDGKENQMTFEQIAPGHFQGMFKNKQFTILNGKLLSKKDAFNEFESDLILKNHYQGSLAMQQGVADLEDKILNSLNQKLPKINLCKLSELTIPNGSKIKVNFTAENGEKSNMTFKQIKPGLFRGSCNKKIFSIANGQVLILRGTENSLNKELILSTFNRAMIGMQQTKLGLQRGEWAIETKLSGDQLNPMELLKAACPDRRLLFETESLTIHNEYRKLHGVPPLVHSELLCEMAREWAEHLALKNTTRKRPYDEYGENLHYSQGVPLDAREIISLWYNEIKLYDFRNPKFTNETEHFTQLVWKDTKEIGTGIAQLGDKIWVCCYYHPPGNGLSKSFEEFVLSPIDVS